MILFGSGHQRREGGHLRDELNALLKETAEPARAILDVENIVGTRSGDQWRRRLPFVKISARIDLLTLSAYLRSHASPIAPNNQGGRHRRDACQTPSNGPHPATCDLQKARIELQ